MVDTAYTVPICFHLDRIVFCVGPNHEQRSSVVWFRFAFTLIELYFVSDRKVHKPDQFPGSDLLSP